jgi:hypothetical protein
MMPWWIAVPLYMGSFYVLFRGGYALNAIANARRIKAKQDHAAFMQRHLVQDRMAPRYQPPKHESRANLRRG